MDLARVVAHVPSRIREEQYEAAVLVPVMMVSGEPHLLFTKRADDLGDHPGQMSFPGGGRESADSSLWETATREANEEIGLQPAEADRKGQLDDIRTVSRYSVTPFVSCIPPREYEPNDREVAEITRLAIDDLTDTDNYENEHRDHPHYGDIVIHYFHVDGYTVWGATARILVQFLELTTDWTLPMSVESVGESESDPST